MRKNGMVEVKLLDAIRHAEYGNTVVLLLDPKRIRVLPIGVGEQEGRAIAVDAGKIEFSRPMTHQLMSKLIDAMYAKVEQVRIDTLKEHTFYATIKLTAGKLETEADARPSDGIALSLCRGTPCSRVKR